MYLSCLRLQGDSFSMSSLLAHLLALMSFHLYDSLPATVGVQSFDARLQFWNAFSLCDTNTRTCSDSCIFTQILEEGGSCPMCRKNIFAVYAAKINARRTKIERKNKIYTDL